MKRLNTYLKLLALLLLAAGNCAWGQTHMTMPSTGQQTVTLQTGVQYTIADPGDTSAYPANCDGSLLLRSPQGTPIIVSGSFETEPTNDFLTLYDATTPDADSVVGTYSGIGVINATCRSGNLLLSFASDAAVQLQGFEITVFACPVGSAEVFGIEVADIGADSAIIS